MEGRLAPGETDHSFGSCLLPAARVSPVTFGHRWGCSSRMRVAGSRQQIALSVGMLIKNAGSGQQAAGSFRLTWLQPPVYFIFRRLLNRRKTN